MQLLCEIGRVVHFNTVNELYVKLILSILKDLLKFLIKDKYHCRSFILRSQKNYKNPDFIQPKNVLAQQGVLFSEFIKCSLLMWVHKDVCLPVILSAVRADARNLQGMIIDTKIVFCPF